MLLPVDEQLRPVGAELVLGGAERTFTESRLFALGGRQLLTVYLRSAGSSYELVSTRLQCDG